MYVNVEGTNLKRWGTKVKLKYPDLLANILTELLDPFSIDNREKLVSLIRQSRCGYEESAVEFDQMLRRIWGDETMGLVFDTEATTEISQITALVGRLREQNDDRRKYRNRAIIPYAAA